MGKKKKVRMRILHEELQILIGVLFYFSFFLFVCFLLFSTASLVTLYRFFFFINASLGQSLNYFPWVTFFALLGIPLWVCHSSLT